MGTGRPSLGNRKQILLRLPLDLVEQINQARGPRPMNSWLEDAARVALRPAFAAVIPDLLVEQHYHRFAPSRTEMKGETRIKWRKCLDCDFEELAA